jgi:hypothetical protein
MPTGMRPSKQRVAGSVTEFIEQVQKILDLRGWSPRQDVWEAWFRSRFRAACRTSGKLLQGRTWGQRSAGFQLPSNRVPTISLVTRP